MPEPMIDLIMVALVRLKSDICRFTCFVIVLIGIARAHMNVFEVVLITAELLGMYVIVFSHDTHQSYVLAILWCTIPGLVGLHSICFYGLIGL